MTQPSWPGVSDDLPSRIEQVREGDRYELSEGEAIYCAPSDPRQGQLRALGAMVLGTDPAVETIGTDVGHALGERTLRAPDLSVGDFGGDQGGWATKAPPLALEYAAQGQDEPDLQRKIKQLLEAGTRLVWVIRLVGPRRVEVYEKGRPVRTKLPGERLEAPGVLASRPLVEALYEREAAFEQTLQNLLARKGYAGLDAVLAEGEARGRAEGEARGKAEGLREGEAKGLREGEARGQLEGEARGKAEGLREGKATALLTVLAARGFEVDAATRARVEACANLARLDRWLARALSASSAPEALDDDAR